MEVVPKITLYLLFLLIFLNYIILLIDAFRVKLIWGIIAFLLPILGIFVFSICNFKRERIKLISLIILYILSRFMFPTYKVVAGGMEPTIIGRKASRFHKATLGDHIFGEKITYNFFNKIFRGDIITFHYFYKKGGIELSRVMGFPGEVIQIKNKRIYVNDNIIEESWLKYNRKMYYSSLEILNSKESTRDNMGPLIIPKKNDIIIITNDKIYIDNEYIINKKIVLNNDDNENQITYRYYFDLYKNVVKKINDYKYLVTDDCYFVISDNRDNCLDSRDYGFISKRHIKEKLFFIYWPPKRYGKKIK